MAVFQINAGAVFRAGNFGLDFAGLFSVNANFYYQVFSGQLNQTNLYLSFSNPTSHAALADIISIIPSITLDHSTFGDTFDTPFYENSALHTYTGVVSDFVFHDYSQGAAQVVGTLTGSIYDLSVINYYSRVLTETQEIVQRNSVDTFTGLFMGDDQVTLGELADYFCDPQGDLILRLGGGDDLGIHMNTATTDDLVKIWGGAGNDQLSTLGGRGALHGGTGRDSVTGYADGAYDIYGGSGGDQVYVKHGVIHDAAGDGDDDYSGDGSGRVLVSYDTQTRGIVADLWSGFVLGAGSGDDTLAGILQLRGTQADDRLIGMPFGKLSEFGVSIWGDTGNDSIAGTSQADRLLGGVGNDQLTGYSGADRLTGGSGNDRIAGGEGNDILFGGAGRDLLIGDADADVFAFLTAAESSVTASDRISDFNPLQDLIDLRGIDANTASAANEAFRFIGDVAFSLAGQVRAFQSGGNTVIEANTTGTGGAEMRLVLTGLFQLADGDFFL